VGVRREVQGCDAGGFPLAQHALKLYTSPNLRFYDGKSEGMLSPLTAGDIQRAALMLEMVGCAPLTTRSDLFAVRNRAPRAGKR